MSFACFYHFITYLISFNAVQGFKSNAFFFCRQNFWKDNREWLKIENLHAYPERRRKRWEDSELYLDIWLNDGHWIKDFFLFTLTVKLNLWVTEQLNKAKLFNGPTFALYYYIHCAYVLCRCRERHFQKKGERLVMNSKAHICHVVLGRDMKKLLYMSWSNFILGSNFVFFRFWVL